MVESLDYFENFKNIDNILPSNWKYEVIEKCSYGIPKRQAITLKVALFSKEDIKTWIQQLEEKTYANYSIRSTEERTGQRVTFKQRLHCRHNTRNVRILNSSVKNRTRNTNCLSSLNISLKRIPKLFKGKAENAPDPKMPCIITFITTHNHDLFSAAAVRFRLVSEKTKKKLIELYRLGHSPRSALECLKIEIQLSNESSELLLADRSICPSYSYCHHLFKAEFKKVYDPSDYQDPEKTFLIKKIEKYNALNGEECAVIDVNESDYTITLCPPLFKRVHENINSASEIVFMDTNLTVGNERSKVFVLWTGSQCGSLPLGIIISSETAESIAVGFQKLKRMLGDSIFHHTTEGPQFFMTDDCEAEHLAIQSVWDKSKCLLCISHVLQDVYRWLISSKNGISRDNAMNFFEQFRSTAFASSQAECERNYNAAIFAARFHPNYIQHLEIYWCRREMWTLSYRPCILKGDTANDISIAIMRLFNEKILNRVKAFNVVQLVDFFLTKFVTYYQRYLFDTIHNHLNRNMLIRTIQVPVYNFLEKIEKVNEHVYLVPSENSIDLHYIVYSDALVCTCIRSNTGSICMHMDLVHALFYSDIYNERIDDIQIRKALFKIARGKVPPQNHLPPLDNQETPNIASEDFETDESCDDIYLIVEPDKVQSILLVEQDTERQTALLKGSRLIISLSNYFTEFLTASPVEVAPALKAMLDNFKTNKNS